MAHFHLISQLSNPHFVLIRHLHCQLKHGFLEAASEVMINQAPDVFPTSPSPYLPNSLLLSTAPLSIQRHRQMVVAAVAAAVTTSIAL